LIQHNGGRAAAVLLEHGADLAAISHNHNGNTPLHAALAGRQADTAKLFVERGADVNVADGAGYAPLHLAAHEGNVALVRMLLDAGADPHALTVAGQTPLSMAEEEGHDEVANLIRV
jgi:ankyrin repeat protein